MGKLGGRELNYSSDIDLLFITQADPVTAQRIGEKLIDALARATGEGFFTALICACGPGGAGPTGLDRPRLRRLPGKDAQTWEKQALLKARSIAGDPLREEPF